MFVLYTYRYIIYELVFHQIYEWRGCPRILRTTGNAGNTIHVSNNNLKQTNSLTTNIICFHPTSDVRPLERVVGDAVAASLAPVPLVAVAVGLARQDVCPSYSLT